MWLSTGICHFRRDHPKRKRGDEVSDSTGPARQSTQSLYVPTIKSAPDEPRHILTHRDGPTACGEQLTGEQTAPQSWQRSQLCLRCVQRYIRTLYGAGSWQWRPEPLPFTEETRE